MSDLIDRQAAISAICNACGKIDCDKMDKCEKLQLPPASCSEFPNNSDTISRAKAIDALDEIETEVADGYGYQYAKWREYFAELPSVESQIIYCDDCRYSEKFVDGLILCRRTKTSHRVFATSTCGKGKREVTT